MTTSREWSGDEILKHLHTCSHHSASKCKSCRSIDYFLRKTGSSLCEMRECLGMPPVTKGVVRWTLDRILGHFKECDSCNISKCKTCHQIAVSAYVKTHGGFCTVRERLGFEIKRDGRQISRRGSEERLLKYFFERFENDSEYYRFIKFHVNASEHERSALGYCEIGQGEKENKFRYYTQKIGYAGIWNAAEKAITAFDSRIDNEMKEQIERLIELFIQRFENDIDYYRFIRHNVKATEVERLALGYWEIAQDEHEEEFRDYFRKIGYSGIWDAAEKAIAAFDTRFDQRLQEQIKVDIGDQQRWVDEGL